MNLREGWRWADWLCDWQSRWSETRVVHVFDVDAFLSTPSPAPRTWPLSATVLFYLGTRTVRLPPQAISRPGLTCKGVTSKGAEDGNRERRGRTNRSCADV